jgi:hypothetical protein
MQHLVAWTSDHLSLKQNHGWKKNGAGFHVSLTINFVFQLSSLLNFRKRLSFSQKG